MRRFVLTLVVAATVVGMFAVAASASEPYLKRFEECKIFSGDNGCVYFNGPKATFYGYNPTVSQEKGHNVFTPGAYGVFSLRHRSRGDLLVIKPGEPGQSLEEAQEAKVGRGSVVLKYPGRFDEPELVTGLKGEIPELRLDTLYEQLGGRHWRFAARVDFGRFSIYIPQLPIPTIN